MSIPFALPSETAEKPSEQHTSFKYYIMCKIKTDFYDWKTWRKIDHKNFHETNKRKIIKKSFFYYLN